MLILEMYNKKKCLSANSDVTLKIFSKTEPILFLDITFTLFGVQVLLFVCFALILHSPPKKLLIFAFPYGPMHAEHDLIINSTNRVC
jgi:hypothetical protein